MAHKALIYVALFLSIAQVVMSVSSSSTESGAARLQKECMNKKNRVQYGETYNDVCACDGDSEMEDDEEVMVEKGDKTEWFVEVLKETLVKGEKIYDDIKNMKEITFPINGYKNKEIAILHELQWIEVQELRKTLESFLAKLDSSKYKPMYEILSVVSNVSKLVLEQVDRINQKKAEEAMRKAKEAMRKAKEDKKKARDDAKKANAAKAKFTKSKTMSMGAKGSSNNSTPKPTSSKKPKSAPKRTPSASTLARDYYDR